MSAPPLVGRGDNPRLVFQKLQHVICFANRIPAAVSRMISDSDRVKLRTYIQGAESAPILSWEQWKVVFRQYEI